MGSFSVTFMSNTYFSVYVTNKNASIVKISWVIQICVSRHTSQHYQAVEVTRRRINVAQCRFSLPLSTTRSWQNSAHQPLCFITVKVPKVSTALSVLHFLTNEDACCSTQTRSGLTFDQPTVSWTLSVFFIHTGNVQHKKLQTAPQTSSGDTDEKADTGMSRWYFTFAQVGAIWFLIRIHVVLS